MAGFEASQNNFEVDGTDNNNSFFAQARGRYRAPYQFSNEVIKEFRVSSNSYSAELGRAGGAVFNVVTKSGSNDWHGSAFYYLRDRDFDAQQAYTDSKPADRQQQLATVGGPIRKDRVFFYAGFDQDILTLPAYVQFANGQNTIVPQPADYEASDQQLVFGAAQKLNAMGGSYPTSMSGNAAFGKVDFVLSPKHLAFVRVNTSRYSGTNNVFFDPSSPITGYAESSNGSGNVGPKAPPLRSPAHGRHGWRPVCGRNSPAMCSSHSPIRSCRGQKSHRPGRGLERSNILPRDTNEHKLHVADTLSYESGRVHWKFGGEFIQAWTYNYYPAMFGGEYY